MVPRRDDAVCTSRRCELRHLAAWAEGVITRRQIDVSIDRVGVRHPQLQRFSSRLVAGSRQYPRVGEVELMAFLQHLARDMLHKRLEEKYEETTGPLKIQHLMQLFAFCQRTFFTFDDRTYEQIKGTPMGSPISILVAELVLQELEKVAFSHYKPAFWRRYVDDTFVIIEKDKLSGLQDLRNRIFPHIQFTREDEEDEKLPFVDVIVTRIRDGKDAEVFGLAVVIVGSLATFFLKNNYGTLIEVSAAIPIVALVVGIFILAILVIVEIALCVVTLTKKTELGAAAERMVNTAFHKQFSDTSIKSAFRMMEDELDCCGITGISDYLQMGKLPSPTCELDHPFNGCAKALSIEFQKFTFMLPVAVIVLGLLQFLAVAGACCLANSIKQQPLSV
ncbi:hypothetical protein SprV_0200654300 [Sparganum proliferum]